MENFAPGLRDAILGLTDTLRFIVYFVAVAGLMLQVQRAHAEVEGLTRPVVRCILVVGLIATLPHWFGFTEKLFLQVANAVNDRYTEHPMQAATVLRDSVADQGGEFSIRRIGESLYRASLWAAAKLVVLIASVLQLPFLLLQYLLKLLCYLFLPMALGLMLVPALTSIGVRYVQQTLAVLAWPIGFSVTELVAYHLLTSYQQNLATAYGLAPGEINAASFASLLGGLLAALWLILGTLGTPFLMQALICSGSPLTAGGAAGLQQVAAVQQLAWILKSVKTGGTAVVAAAGKTLAGGAAGGSPPPPPLAVIPPAPTTADPTGDLRAQSALAADLRSTPHTTI